MLVYILYRQHLQIDGELLKLQIPSLVAKAQGGQVNSLGYGKKSEDVTMDYPQPSPKSLS